MAPPTETSGRYGGLAASERVAARRTRLVDTAFDLLGTEGWNATTVRGVCARARLNPRYFYESFGDLDALLVAVFDRTAAQLTTAFLDAYERAPQNARAKARAAIEAIVGHLDEDPRRARVLFVESLALEPLARRRHATMGALSQLLAERSREFYGRSGDPDPISDMAAALLVGGVAELIVAWLEERLAVSREQLVEDLVELFVITGEGAIAIAEGRERR